MRGKFEQIERANDARLHRVHRIGLIVRRRSGACEIVNLIHRQIDRIDDIVAHEAERVVTQEIAQVLKPPRRKIIDADDEVSFVQKTFAKMRTEKSGTACYKNAPC